MAEAAVRCGVCPHFCLLEDGEQGFCRGRRASDGAVVDENYGRITSLALDPIEKKPLVRFRPGTMVLSVGSYGCNLHCPFCQNASIACAGPGDVPWRMLAPEEVAALAVELKDRGNIGVAFTYNEPLIGYEFVRDTGRLVHGAGLVNVLVSNGMVNPGPLDELLPLIDGANIDLKGFSQAFYDRVDGSLSCVKRTIAAMAEDPHCHLEVTTLIIPGWNDDAEQIEAAAAWLASLDPSIVYHLTRFFPCHRLADRQPTPADTVRELVAVARRHLPFVYAGNCG